MKKTVTTLIAIIVAVASLHAFRVMRQSAIKGKIYPAEAVDIVAAINGTDTLKLKPGDGNFNFVVKPGAWKLLVNTKKPWKSVTIDADAKEGQTTDLGEIKLEQQ